MRKLQVITVWVLLSWFVTSGFGLFSKKMADQKQSAATGSSKKTEASTVQTAAPSETLDIRPEGAVTPATGKKKKLSRSQAAKLKKEAERIKRQMAVVRDAQSAMNTTKALSSLSGLPGGGGGSFSAIPSIAGVPSVPSVPSIPSIPPIAIPGAASGATSAAGLPAGVQSALQTAQNVQSLQSTLDQIKSEQERIRKEQERIRQERERLERQTATTPVKGR